MKWKQRRWLQQHPDFKLESRDSYYQHFRDDQVITAVRLRIGQSRFKLHMFHTEKYSARH